MKFRLTFKDPDGVHRSLVETLGHGPYQENKSPILDKEMDDMLDAMKPWIEWQEYVTIEIDTETKEAIVVPV